MMFPPCPDADMLRRLLADQLSLPETNAVETHVQACDACQQALERLTAGADQTAASRLDTGADFLRRLEANPPTANAPASPPTLHQGNEPRPIHLARAGRPAQTEDIAALLRRRMLFLSALSLVVVGVYAATFLPYYLSVVSASLYSGLILLTAALVALLSSRRLLTFQTLRRLEVLLFACLAVYFSWVQYGFLSLGWLGRSAQHDWEGMFLLARALNSLWFGLIVGYGLLIPNTWRRCAAVVGTLSVWPVMLNAVTALGDPAIEARLALLFVGESAINIVIAAALAIFGAQRFEALRSQTSAVRRLGLYTLTRWLGSGGMGEVWLAEHGLLRRPCAVKLIRTERVGDPQALRRFEREVQATAALSHPNTVEIYDYGLADDGTFYYAMEYLPGLSLQELVAREGPLLPARAVHLLRQVCGALAEAHSTGLVHRDIKPANVIVCERGGLRDVAKLLDFGLVRECGPGHTAETLTEEGTIAGTPAYMSPEQTRGFADVDGRSDLYSLGAVAYFLLTGQPPFVRESAVQTLAAHLAESVLPPDRLRPDLPNDLQAVVLRCLEKAPEQRYDNASELEHALAACHCSQEWVQPGRPGNTADGELSTTRH
jgi:serine/threonine-protein kinase